MQKNWVAGYDFWKCITDEKMRLANRRFLKTWKKRNNKTETGKRNNANSNQKNEKKKGKNCLKNATGEPQFLNMAKKKSKNAHGRSHF